MTGRRDVVSIDACFEPYEEHVKKCRFCSPFSPCMRGLAIMHQCADDATERLSPVVVVTLKGDT